MAKHYPNLCNVLKQLLHYHRLRPADLARETQIPVPTIHRFVSGKTTRPYKASLAPLAEYFKISTPQLLGEEPLPLEITTPVPTETPSKTLITIPVLAWQDLINIDKARNTVDTIAATNELSPNCFALRVPDSSMEPLFQAGALIICDPNRTPTDRSYCILQIGESKQFVFRQLLIDLDDKFFKPLHPDLAQTQMRRFDPSSDRVVATLVEARQMY